MKSKVLIIHSIAWSHYAARVFSEMNSLCSNEEILMKVIHLAKTSNERIPLGQIDLSEHNYTYRILFNNSIENLSWYRECIKLMKEILCYKPTIIIIGGWNRPSFIFAALLNRLLGKINIICSDSTAYDRNRKCWKENLKRIFLKLFIDYAFCIGTRQFNYLSTLGFNERKIYKAGWYVVDNMTIKNLFNRHFLERDEIKKSLGLPDRNFIYVGRLAPEKNVETLIRAYAKIDSNNWGLIIIGDGQSRPRLEEYSKKLCLNNVFFFGGKSWQEVPKYYALADVFILPSLSEPWGLVVNEAMACGLPVIVSNKVGASADLVVNGQNGFVFDPDNVEELASIMLKFVRNEVNGLNMGKKSWSMIKERTPKNEADKILQIIKKLLEKNIET